MYGAVITGANGMIGATLTRRLLSKGARVMAIVRPGSNENVPPHERLALVQCDLSELCGIAPGGEKYDAFFHFGWKGTYGAARDDMYAQNLNVRYALDAVTLAARLGCERFVGAGSQAEYGPSGERLDEQTPLRPVSGYGAAKLSACLMCGIEAKRLGLDFIWARVLSVYGPMDKPYTLTQSAIRGMLLGEETRFTKGEQLWDFLYSEDAARAFELLYEKGRAGECYVVGSGEEIRLADALNVIARSVGPSARVGLGALPYPAGQVMRLCADISKLRADTGFTPLVGFERGINSTIRWVKESCGL